MSKITFTELRMENIKFSNLLLAVIQKQIVVK